MVITLVKLVYLFFIDPSMMSQCVENKSTTTSQLESIVFLALSGSNIPPVGLTAQSLSECQQLS